MRRTDPGLAAIRDALEDYELTTEPTAATAAGRTERIGEYLLASGYVIRPRRSGVRRFLPRGGRHTHRFTYAAAITSMTLAILCGFVQLWAPAAGLIVCSAVFADLAHRQRYARTLAAAAEQAARPKDLA
ncbi:hypothetical protein AB0903_31085 [Streptomyces sp. NPDC048389]|uniref:hypothetical protein n=1 Tax=Streptomyces sp. NPDC048389 TaxID=3154622 RepID=UPI003452A871